MTIGSVKTIPRPGSHVMEEALSLLSTFGKEGDGNKALLEEMKTVQIHNEEIYKQITAAIKENSQLVAEAKQINIDLRNEIDEEAKALKKRTYIVTAREKEVRTKERALKDDIEQHDIERANIEARLSIRKDALKEAEVAVKNDQLLAAACSAKAKQDINAFEFKFQRVNEIKLELESALQGIKEL